MIRIVPEDDLSLVLQEKRTKYLVLGERNLNTFNHARKAAAGCDDRMVVFISDQAFSQFRREFPALDPSHLVSLCLCTNNKVVSSFHSQQLLPDILTAYQEAALVCKSTPDT